MGDVTSRANAFLALAEMTTDGQCAECGEALSNAYGIGVFIASARNDAPAIIRELMAENERLREGLRKIQNHPTDYMIGTDDNMEVLRGIADAALAGEKAEQDGR